MLPFIPVLVFDFFYYWLHRLQHEVPALWEQHKLHHMDETLSCLTNLRHHWLEEEIALLKPKAIVALGATAAASLLDRKVAVTRERGHWLRRADGLPVLITLHPSALLRLRGVEREEAIERWLEDLRRGGDEPPSEI